MVELFGIPMTDHQLYERALRVTPLASQTRSKAPGRVGPKGPPDGSPFPLFAREGCGAYVYDRFGKKYLDFAGANAAIPLGYGHPAVVEAVSDAVRRGNLLSLASELEVDVSEQFCAMVGAESVRWLKTGSEAVSAAMRLARAATCASTVLVAENSYHGWHDWTYARFGAGFGLGHYALPNGVPAELRDTVFVYKPTMYGDEGLLATLALVHKQGRRVAAIVVEPDRLKLSQAEFLHDARAAATACGAVLIFDEMVYGFRWAHGGGGEYFGVRPDLACFGKAIGNGVPVACVCGRRELLDRCDMAFVSGTYGGDLIGLAAVKAVMEVYRREGVIEKLWQKGKLFFDTFEQCSAETSGMMGNRLWRLKGFPVHWSINWTYAQEPDEVLPRIAMRGYLFHRDAENASAVMTDEEVMGAARALAEELSKPRSSSQRQG